jgi:AcrR family transcriptional regulator
VKSPTSTRKYHHGDLRRALLEAATAREPEAVSLRELAASLGVSPASVYRHFESKQALLDELASQGFVLLRGRFADCFDLRTPVSDPEEALMRLQKLGEAYLVFADEEPALWRLMFGVFAASYREKATAKDDANAYAYLPAALEGLHAAGLLPRPLEPADVLFVWTVIHGLASLRQGRVPLALVPVEAITRSMVVRILFGLGCTDTRALGKESA